MICDRYEWSSYNFNLSSIQRSVFFNKTFEFHNRRKYFDEISNYNKSELQNVGERT
jgi:hypothetical protein